MRFSIIVLTALFLTSCSSDKENKDKGISVFRDSNIIEVDKSLSDIKITIPQQSPNSFWSRQNNYNNSRIENFALSKDLKKKKTIWSGYRTSYKYRNVFAPAIEEDKIYLLDDKGNLSARNLADYKKLWKKRIIDKKSRKNFTIGKIFYKDNKVFVTSGYNQLTAHNAQNGDVVWSKELASIPISTPIADDKRLYVITNDNKTYALNNHNGEILWVHSGILKNTGILGAADPVFYKNSVIISYSSGEIYLIDKRSGETLWSYDLNLNRATNSDFILNDIDATPIIKDDVVYAVGNGGLMMAISIKDGAVLWQKELATITDFWIAGDFIYLVNNDNQLICLYTKTGGIKWF
ncbi:MAG: PQQ-like beta-propeller repeat protein, partial [Proteobacteria bacterium]|nr:PQQ-like beta-propeller repeat protein [Pseudomonadota bacterium]